ncbi:MAG: carotenoid oxygenase family protein [Acidimicrobiales bacterium]
MLERRQFLGLLAAAAAATAVGGCASEVGAPPGTTVGATPGTPPPPFDPSRGYWMQGGFAPVAEEVTLTDLPVRGTLPSTLSGLYVRNGSNPKVGDSPHWFLGDGMVHGVQFEGGRPVWYRNRWVRTPFVEEGLGGLDAPPGGARNQSNVSIGWHGGRLLTMGEVGWPYELSPEDLSTVGAHDFAGKLTTAMTAHPKIDPATGELHFFGYGFVPPFLTYHVADASGALVHSSEIPIQASTMIHDFAITDRDVVFWDLPVLFDLQAGIQMVTGATGAMPYRWTPANGARLGVMPLGGTGDPIRWVEIDPCYVFHGTNAFRDGDDVVLDVCRLEHAFTETEDLGVSTPHRWRIDTSTMAFTDEPRGDLPMDLPAIDRRVAGRPYRHGWYVEVDEAAAQPLELAGIRWMDHDSGETAAWRPDAGVHANEVVFVPEDDGEGEGWLLTYAYDANRGASDLVVLDATDVAAGPVGAVELPVRVPYGFHGTWVPA